MSDTEKPQPIDGEDQYILIDKAIGKIASIVTVLQQAKKTRKVTEDMLELLPELVGRLDILNSELQLSIEDDKNLKSLVRKNDPAGLPITISRSRIIDAYGFGDLVLRMRKKKCTIQEIADVIGVTPRTVSEWLQEQLTKTPEERKETITAAAERQAQSVFDLEARLEEHQKLLHRILQRFEAEEIEVTGVPIAMVLSELRQTYKLSFDMMDRVVNARRKEAFKQAIVNAVENKAPGIKAEIYAEIERLMNQESLFGGQGL